MSICGNSAVNGNSSGNWWSFPINNEESSKKKPLELALAKNSVMYAASMQAFPASMQANATLK